MLIGIPKERLPNESRVAATPKTVEQLIKLGFSVTLEHDAGKRASFDDESYIAAGATLSDREQVWQSDIVLKVNAPDDEEIALTRAGSTLVSFYLARTESRSAVKAGRTSGHGNGNGFSAAYLTSAVAGCPELYGEHCRLSRHCRSRP